eukprot:gene13475-9283_t
MGGAGQSFATCCAVFSVLGVVHLLLFAFMLSHQATSFALMGVDRGWDLDAKAQTCYMGAVLYGITLFVSVLARVYLRRQGIARNMMGRRPDGEPRATPPNSASLQLRSRDGSRRDAGQRQAHEVTENALAWSFENGGHISWCRHVEGVVETGGPARRSLLYGVVIKKNILNNVLNLLSRFAYTSLINMNTTAAAAGPTLDGGSALPSLQRVVREGQWLSLQTPHTFSSSSSSRSHVYRLVEVGPMKWSSALQAQGGSGRLVSYICAASPCAGLIALHSPLARSAAATAAASAGWAAPSSGVGSTRIDFYHSTGEPSRLCPATLLDVEEEALFGNVLHLVWNARHDHLIIVLERGLLFLNVYGERHTSTNGVPPAVRIDFMPSNLTTNADTGEIAGLCRGSGGRMHVALVAYQEETKTYEASLLDVGHVVKASSSTTAVLVLVPSTLPPSSHGAAPSSPSSSASPAASGSPSPLDPQCWMDGRMDPSRERRCPSSNVFLLVGDRSANTTAVYRCDFCAASASSAAQKTSNGVLREVEVEVAGLVRRAAVSPSGAAIALLTADGTVWQTNQAFGVTTVLHVGPGEEEAVAVGPGAGIGWRGRTAISLPRLLFCGEGAVLHTTHRPPRCRSHSAGDQDLHSEDDDEDEDSGLQVLLIKTIDPDRIGRHDGDGAEEYLLEEDEEDEELGVTADITSATDWGSSLFVPEVDGIRILRRDSLHFLQVVPAEAVRVFGWHPATSSRWFTWYGSRAAKREPGMSNARNMACTASRPPLAPAAVLRTSYEEFVAGKAVAAHALLQLQQNGDGALDAAITDCIIAATMEFHVKQQQALLRVAAFGKSFARYHDADLFIRVTMALRVQATLAAGRPRMIVSYTECRHLGGRQLMARLTQEGYHAEAWAVCTGMGWMTDDRRKCEWALQKLSHDMLRKGMTEEAAAMGIIAFVQHTHRRLPVYAQQGEGGGGGAETSGAGIPYRKKGTATASPGKRRAEVGSASRLPSPAAAARRAGQTGSLDSPRGTCLFPFTELASAAKIQGYDRAALTFLEADESSALQQVPLLLVFQQPESALQRAVAAADPDLIFTVLQYFLRSPDMTASGRGVALASAVPVARQMLLDYVHACPHYRTLLRPYFDAHPRVEQLLLLNDYRKVQQQLLRARDQSEEHSGAAEGRGMEESGASWYAPYQEKKLRLVQQMIAGLTSAQPPPQRTAPPLSSAAALKGGGAAAAAASSNTNNGSGSGGGGGGGVGLQTISARYIRLQATIVEQQSHLAAAYHDVRFLTASVAEMIQLLLEQPGSSGGGGAPSSSALDTATRLKQTFDVPDGMFQWCRAKALAETGQWEALDRLAAGGLPALSGEALVTLLLSYGRTQQAVRYIPRIPQLEEQLETYVQCAAWAAAGEACGRARDADLLEQLKMRARGSGGSLEAVQHGWERGSSAAAPGINFSGFFS